MTNNKSAQGSWCAATALALTSPHSCWRRTRWRRMWRKWIAGTRQHLPIKTRGLTINMTSTAWGAPNPSAQLHQPPCPECNDIVRTTIIVSYGFFGDVLPRTPEGEKRLQMNKPTRGIF